VQGQPSRREHLLNYEAHLRLYLVPVLGKRRLDQIKPTDITAIKSSLSAKSHNTMCEVLKTLRRVFNVAITQKHITSEPVELEIPRRHRKAVIAYDAAQQAALLAAARELGPFYELVVLLGIDGGLRRGEIVGLQWSDINFGQGYLVVRHNIVRGKLDLPKGRTEDEVGLTSRLVAALKAFRHDDGPFVLTNKRGGHFSEQDPSRGWRSSRAWRTCPGTGPTSCGRPAGPASPTAVVASRPSPRTCGTRTCRPRAATSTATAPAPTRPRLINALES
jgi:integrase